MRSDAELAKAAMEGDRPAFAELVRRYERVVCAVTLDVLDDRHTALDAAQDTFVAAWLKLDRLREPGAFGQWLLKIARRRAIKQARGSAKTVQLDESKVSRAPDCNRRLDGISQGLLAVVTKLPAHERKVVMLKYFSGQSVRAIAEITDRPIGTVTKQLSRARARLRTWLEGTNHV